LIDGDDHVALKKTVVTQCDALVKKVKEAGQELSKHITEKGKLEAKHQDCESIIVHLSSQLTIGKMSAQTIKLKELIVNFRNAKDLEK
jgi:hypothetical protein